MQYVDIPAFMARKRAEYTDVREVLRAVQHWATWEYECERADGSRVLVSRLWMLPQTVQDAYSRRMLLDVRANLASRPDGALMQYLGVTNDEHSIE